MVWQGRVGDHFPYADYIQPENVSVAAVLLWPEVTVNGTLDAVELVFTSDGLQSGVLEPSVVNANASIV